MSSFLEIQTGRLDEVLLVSLTDSMTGLFSGVSSSPTDRQTVNYATSLVEVSSGPGQTTNPKGEFGLDHDDKMMTDRRQVSLTGLLTTKKNLS